MRKLWYVGLESYKARYTLQLTDWNTRVFKKEKVTYEVIKGDSLSASQEIVTGQVLDAHGRSYYAMSQMMNIVKKLKEGKMTQEDVLFFEDMFHPGIESLPYILCQTPTKYRPRIFLRCLAQTIDPDDFVHKTGMFDWMRKYEEMVCNFADGLLVASEEMVAHFAIAGWKVPTYVTGLPFGKAEVRSRAGKFQQLFARNPRVCFAARWDEEKQPQFYLSVMKRVKELTPGNKDVEFCILSGSKLRSNREYLLNAAKKSGVKIYDNLEKEQYYKILANSWILFNCALQDWVSNTISEADALGTLVLYPTYRSFPEAVGNNRHVMYKTWSVDDAAHTLISMMNDVRGSWDDPSTLHKYRVGAISDYQDATIHRTLKVFNGVTAPVQLERGWYREQVSETKF